MSGNFSFDTVSEFDKHIEHSIPRYSDIHKCVNGLINYYIRPGSTIIDIGCSTGKLLKRIKKENPESNCIGYDVSQNLLPNDNSGCKFIFDNVLSNHVMFPDSSIVISMFTLSFIPKEDRLYILQKIYNSINYGGLLIVSDKCYAESPRIQDIFTFLYYDFKKRKFSNDEIMDKELSLRSIQEPMESSEYEYLFKTVGFHKVETFWKYFNFQGWICLK